MAGWFGEVGPVRLGASGGIEAELALGRTTTAISEGVEVLVGWRWFELGGEVQRYDSLGGLSFNKAVTTTRLINDPERFTDISNDYGTLAGRLSVSAGRVGIHGGAWKAFKVRNGPGDFQGATLGVSTWW
ncbi:MAG: hypothetical protein GY913_12920 [Proteobacteria bacterium]|nr:hypothetical protein [Pseudomonadota bacterium]MCP4917809.1 hypothetical protein [Pseudomonadota bacterium]